MNIDEKPISYTLTDAIQMHKEFPRTFLIPTKSEIKRLKVGDMVKLFFQTKDEFYNKEDESIFDTERMWVELISIDDNYQNFTGILANQPICTPYLDMDDIVHFQSNHICATMLPYDIAKIDVNMSCMISQRAFNEKFVDFAIRKKDTGDGESGWLFFYDRNEYDHWRNESLQSNDKKCEMTQVKVSTATHQISSLEILVEKEPGIYIFSENEGDYISI
ncbi:hypothetical protein TRFO_04776 [Tritrichomonas foetus]|uniref:DUF2314 domain-containing protein n=1 Tax=Tritrichomonas foetus TaxID=1144522 RepID=A0A1J4KCN8_9EUKA|nr:hypothetical protein TRFO_04776 [Tritrichomonas foetus]|eukprot:OHT08704.1 hypothetical protein TRFO_04776 [Tritrichomonas foetus]